MAFKFGQVVLVDTNVILEAHRIGCWAAIAQHFSLHTVAKVVEETQTGYQNRHPETWIDEAKLRAAFDCVVDVTDEERIVFNVEHTHPALDAGERDLLLYAQTLQESAWLLNSPDSAAVRFAHRQGWIDRVVSLEAMSSSLKAKLREDMRDNYTERWLASIKTRLLLG